MSHSLRESTHTGDSYYVGDYLIVRDTTVLSPRFTHGVLGVLQRLIKKNPFLFHPSSQALRVSLLSLFYFPKAVGAFLVVRLLLRLELSESVRISAWFSC